MKLKTVTMLCLSCIMLASFLMASVKAQVTLPSILASADSWVDTYWPNFNFGADRELFVGRYPQTDDVLNIMRTLVTFDLPSIPSEAVITSAKLYLRNSGVGGTLSPPRSIGVHRVTSSWMEGDGTATPFQPSTQGVTWNNQPSFLSEPTSTITVGDGVPLWISWDITLDVQNGYNNPTAWYGILLKDENEEPPIFAGFSVYSKDQVEFPERRPYLLITYETIVPAVPEFTFSIPIITSFATLVYLAIRKQGLQR